MSSRIILSRLPVRTVAARTLSTSSRAAHKAGPATFASAPPHPLPPSAALPVLSSAARAAASSASSRTARLWARAAAAAAAATGAGLLGATACAAADGADVADAPLTKEEVAAAAAAIHDLLDNDEDDDGMGPTLVRLAWHASGTYDKTTHTGGSDGATMRFKPESGHGANAGLHVARNALEPIKKLFPRISYADLWTLAGAVAIEHMGGPTIVWRPGRRDAENETSCTPDGRLPDPDKGKVGATIRHVRSIFQRQGFSDREMVALIGAHALGRCYKDRSGYDGPWTRSPTTFSNTFFTELLENRWTLREWDGPDQFEDPTGDLMMLPSDMALLWDKEFRKYVVEFAADEDKYFKSFADAFQKLEENGVKAFDAPVTGEKAWYRLW